MANGDDKKRTKVVLSDEPSGAYSRFTRTPITIRDEGAIRAQMQQMQQSLQGLGFESKTESDPYRGPSEGEYSPERGIEVTSFKDQPSYSDVAGTISHEDIHALLEKMGYTYPRLTADPHSLWSTLMYDPQTLAEQGMIGGKRAGDPTKEVPAYVGAYKPYELPGFSDVDRQRYLSRLYSTLPPDKAATLKRIIGAYEAGQRFIK